MDMQTLFRHLKDVKVRTHLFNGYEDAFSLGVTRDPADPQRLAIHLNIVGDPQSSRHFPTEVQIAGETFRVIVTMMREAPQAGRNVVATGAGSHRR